MFARRPEAKKPMRSALALVPVLQAHETVATLATRQARILALLLANLCLQGLDALVTYTALRRGHTEGNPLVGALMEFIGPTEGLLAAKVLAVALLLLIYRRRNHRFVEPGLISLAVTYTVFAVVPWVMILANGPS